MPKLKLNQLLLQFNNLPKQNQLQQHRLNLSTMMIYMLPRIMPSLPKLMHLSSSSQSQMMGPQTKTVMTLATTKEVITKARTLTLEPVRVVLVAIRSRSPPLSEKTQQLAK